LSSRFTATDADWSQGDSDGDGTVTFGDFLKLSANFGKKRELPPETPEGEPPSSVVAAALAAQRHSNKSLDATFAADSDWLLPY
jgi:hypothetical protein